ncbi:unnamed protein product [Closterium sp. NIES-54]
MSGTLSVGHLGVVLAARTSFAQGVDIYALDYDAILTAMYALTIGTKGDCSLCVLPDPGIEVAALGASESALPGTAPAEALHTFTLDSGASCCFIRDSTTLTPLSRPVLVRLVDPSGGPVVARSSTVLPCPAAPSGSRSGLHLPSFSARLVSTTALQDAMVTTITPGGQRVSICTCTRTGRHLATSTCRPGSSLATEPPQVAASPQVSASGQVVPTRSCRLLSHQTLLWHHRLGHPSLPCLRGMHSCLLVSGLPRSLPPLPPSPAPPCLPCVEGRQRAAPHSSSFPLTTAPLQTLHMDVWGLARVSGLGLRLQLRERFHQDLPVLRLHSDTSGEFSSDLCALQSFTLPASPQKIGIVERRIGLVMEVARTSMIHAVAPHFLWPFAVRYAVHQLNLWPRVYLPKTSPTLRWTGEVGDASVFRVWGSRAFVRDTSVDKLSARAIPCVFLGFPPDAPGRQFYHPTSRHVFPSQDVTFDESVPFYHLFPYRSAPPPPPPLFLAPGPPPAPGSCSLRCLETQVLLEVLRLGVLPRRGAESGGAEPGGAEHEEPLSPQQLREWFARRTRLRSGAVGAGASAAEDTGVGGVGATCLGGAGVTAGAGGTGGTAAAGLGGARTRGTRSAGTGSVGGTGDGGARAGDPAEPRGAGFGGSGAGGSGAGGAGAGAGDTRAVDPGAGGAGARGAGAGGTLRPRS